MKRMYLVWMMVAAVTAVYAQTPQELEIAQSYVVECKSVAEITQAKNAGALYLKTAGGSYFVNVQNDYKGPFKDLKTAVKVRKQYGLPLPEKKAEGGVSGKVASNELLYNPQLMIYPFVDIKDQKQLLFTVPSGEAVSASQVMIHPNPVQFSEVSFAPVNLAANLKALQDMKKDVPSPESLAPELRQKTYFAVAGKLEAKEKIQFPELDYAIGAAVVDNNGDVLWKTYGTVDERHEFKCVQEIGPTSGTPQFLLLFILGKGPLKEMLSPVEGLPKLDATPYSYHVLGSVALEMGPRWFPPLEKAAKEEYQAMLQEIEGKRPPVFPEQK